VTAAGDFRIVPARAADAAGIALLLGELGYPTSPADVPARLAAVEAEGGATLLAADGAGAVLGLASVTSHAALHTGGPVAYVMALVVASAARGRGVGRGLLEAAERWARKRGCERLSLTSAEHRAEAHLFYPRCGLPYTGRRYSKVLKSS
jgi:GNAT superfamily N-acetyltransferase